MADIKWEAPTVALTAYQTTTLNSLADNALDLGSTTIDNETNLCTFMDLELELASLDLSGQTSPAAHIYLIESVDGGTGFDTGSDAETVDANMPAPDKLVAILGFRPYSGAETKRAIKSMIPIPPGQFKLAIRNKCGAAWGSSGNQLSYRTYNLVG
jgi:hypothetical protein